MKRAGAVLVLLVFVMTVSVAFGASDRSEFSYRKKRDGTIKITDYHGSTSVTELKIPNTIDGMQVTDVSQNVFIGCSKLTKFIVAADHPGLAVIDGVLFNKKDKRLISYPRAKKEREYSIPYGIKEIGMGAFSCSNNLVSVLIPASMRRIRTKAFENCNNLSVVVIAYGVEAIDGYAFTGCSKIASISLPDSVTELGEWAFSFCSSLQSVILSDNITTIRTQTFFYCSKLIDIELPRNLTKIGSSAFDNCTNLKELTIPSSVRSIGSSAFYRCDKLELTVTTGYVEEYCRKNNLRYILTDPIDWLYE